MEDLQPTSSRSEFEIQIEQKMRKFEDILDRMGKGEEGKTLRQEFEDLRSRYVSVKENYKRLKSASSDAFDDVKSGFQSAWNDLRDAMRNAADKLLVLGAAETERRTAPGEGVAPEQRAEEVPTEDTHPVAS